MKTHIEKCVHAGPFVSLEILKFNIITSTSYISKAFIDIVHSPLED